MKAIINGVIIKEDTLVSDEVLLFQEKIFDFQSLEAFEKINGSCEEIIDAEGNYIAPGFIDLHIHGYAGHDVMDGSLEALSKISSSVVKNGVTGFLATTMTMSKSKIYTALDMIRVAMSSEPKGAKVLGAHMEGPFINGKHKGAQQENFILKPSYKFIEDYVDVLKLITLAPEMDDALEFIKAAKEKTNIILSIGHSNASYEEAMWAIRNGISHTTHTFNAMSPLNHRFPGIVGAAFNSDIYCEVIADGIHIHPAIIKILTKLKGMDKIILITDCMRAGGLGNGISELGGQKIIVCNNAARLEDGTLAGSILKLNKGLKNFMDATDMRIWEAIKLVSINPARELGLDKLMGSLSTGKLADIVIFDENINIKQTIIEGKTVYKSIHED